MGGCGRRRNETCFTSINGCCEENGLLGEMNVEIGTLRSYDCISSGKMTVAWTRAIEMKMGVNDQAWDTLRIESTRRANGLVLSYEIWYKINSDFQDYWYYLLRCGLLRQERFGGSEEEEGWGI